MASTGKGGRSSSSRTTRTSRRVPRTTKASPNAPKTARAPLMAPGTVRSILGIVLLVIGGVTLLALFLGGQGLFGQFVTDVLRPSFGQGAWLLGVLLIVAGVMVERSATVHSGWAVDDRRRHPRVPGGGGAHPPHLDARQDAPPS